MISYLSTFFACVFSAVLSIYFYQQIVTIPLRRRAKTAEKAYSELTAQSAIRERELIKERTDAEAHVVAERTRRDDRLRVAHDDLSEARRLLDTVRKDARASIEDAYINADRLAPVVFQYAKDIRETMVLMKDETPPKELVAAEEALRLHEEQVKLRNKT